MKSLIRSAPLPPKGNAVQEKTPAPAVKSEEAQCCAKVSKTVAGCHD